MAKKCPSCGFADNPDDACYCGKCGKHMGGYEWWRLYDTFLYVLVERSKLKEYERYEQEAKDYSWKKIWKSVQECSSDFWKEHELAIVSGIAFIIFIAIIYGIRLCFNIQL